MKPTDGVKWDKLYDKREVYSGSAFAGLGYYLNLVSGLI